VSGFFRVSHLTRGELQAAVAPAAFAPMAGSSVAPAIRVVTDEVRAGFRANVGAACLAAVTSVLEDACAGVDPFESPPFGLAVARGKAMGGMAAPW
jgi:hypothetical protein